MRILLTKYTDNVISFMHGIANASGCLHYEFVSLLFLQVHRETGRLFCSFRSSVCSIYQWTVPLPSLGVHLIPKNEGKGVTEGEGSVVVYRVYDRESIGTPSRLRLIRKNVV